MGKNGDQIQRLFKTAACVFIVQYWGQVAESVVEQMAEFAKAKSATEASVVFYGIIVTRVALPRAKKMDVYAENQGSLVLKQLKPCSPT
jgi:hypothetical protein